MIIELREIPEGGKRIYEGREEGSILALEDERVFCRAGGPIDYRLAASAVSSRLIVRGKVWTIREFRCSRCNEYFRREVRDDDFERVVDLSKDTVSVDLTGEIRETILLHFPGYPVCRADCKGLCVQCGASLNVGSCGCRPRGDNRWGGLDAIGQLGR